MGLVNAFGGQVEVPSAVERDIHSDYAERDAGTHSRGSHGRQRRVRVRLNRWTEPRSHVRLLAVMPRPVKATIKAEATRREALVSRAPRLGAAERKQLILSEAAQFFSEHGFQGTTRELARRLGITQAALYKHFPSKDAIITALFEPSAERWRSEDWRPGLAHSDVPIATRL